MQTYDDPDLPAMYDCCVHCDHPERVPDQHNSPCSYGCNWEDLPHD